jgi:hypothetical protein
MNRVMSKGSSTWLFSFIRKYLREDYNIDIDTLKITGIVKQMIKEGFLSESLIDDAMNHEFGENTALHEIVAEISVFIDSDNYKNYPSTIKITRSTKDLLDALKDHPRQSYEEVIRKLLE